MKLARDTLRGYVLEEVLGYLIRNTGYRLLVDTSQDPEELGWRHNGLVVKWRADLVVGLDSEGNLRVVCTAGGRGDGDHAVALFPELPAGEMIRRTVSNLGRVPHNKSKAG